MGLKKYIPNSITLLNLLSGCLAVIFAVSNDFFTAAIFVFLGIFFDFFDGLLARKFNVQSPLGIQLDSLADMVTSGLVPGIVMFKLISISMISEEPTYSTGWNESYQLEVLRYTILPVLGLFITLASAYRLAKFNLDEDQQTSFKGLPTPANALMIISLPLVIQFQNSDLLTSIILNPWFLLVVTALSCYLLNSSINLFALKFKHYGLEGNYFRYGLLLLSVILIVWLQFAAIPLIIISYIILSLLHYSVYKH
ncbi:CDP-diacylglycerol---serine O-phosphatidyltransferase [Flavobacteriaceae bacterium MAR_2010_188]|nr:CDP-diacylglycerol---serine O-phosphatidyltransferase [Flavobacteriaceae bacterium MAR_2010_188]